MAEGEIGAAFKALAKQMAEAMERAARKIASVGEETAERAAAGGKGLQAADAAAGKRFDEIGAKATASEGPAAELAGPPWPVADGVVVPRAAKTSALRTTATRWPALAVARSELTTPSSCVATSRRSATTSGRSPLVTRNGMTWQRSTG